MSGVVTLIKEDHQKLESVFKKLEKAEPAEIPDLLRQVQELLVPHSKAEEQVVYPAIKSIVPDESSDVDDGLEEHHHVEQTLQELLASDPEAPGVDGLIAAMIGEAAISRPVIELVKWRSASESRNHAAMISKKANPSSGFQCLRTIVGIPLDNASGRRTAAPTAVRVNTKTGTETPSTAILISRYGMPQITPIATNRTHPRRLTRSPRHAPGRRYGDRSRASRSLNFSPRINSIAM